MSDNTKRKIAKNAVSLAVLVTLFSNFSLFLGIANEDNFEFVRSSLNHVAIALLFASSFFLVSDVEWLKRLGYVIGIAGVFFVARLFFYQELLNTHDFSILLWAAIGQILVLNVLAKFLPNSSKTGHSNFS